jgi:hypothetical protein
MTVNIGTLYRKRTVRNLSGNIVDMVDESDGGTIISKGRVVNEEKILELKKKEDDRKVAAQAQSQQAIAPAHIEETRTAQPSKLQEMEKKIADQDVKLDAILALLSKK